jgi:hypothetical protein
MGSDWAQTFQRESDVKEGVGQAINYPCLYSLGNRKWNITLLYAG